MMMETGTQIARFALGKATSLFCTDLSSDRETDFQTSSSLRGVTTVLTTFPAAYPLTSADRACGHTEFTATALGGTLMRSE